MPWFTKKKKEEGKFQLFRPYSRPISAVSCMFRPYRPPANMTQYGWYGLILAESAWFGANRGLFGTNRAASARIEPSRREFEEKKKKNADVDRHVGNRVGHGCGVRPCFLAHISLVRKLKYKISKVDTLDATCHNWNQLPKNVVTRSHNILRSIV